MTDVCSNCSSHGSILCSLLVTEPEKRILRKMFMVFSTLSPALRTQSIGFGKSIGWKTYLQRGFSPTNSSSWNPWWYVYSSDCPTDRSAENQSSIILFLFLLRLSLYLSF